MFCLIFKGKNHQKNHSIHKFLKFQVTQLVQSPSHLIRPKSKFPKLPRPKLLKVQVTQISSHPKLKLPKIHVTQIAKSPSCPGCQKSKLPPCRKNLLLSHGQEYSWRCNSQQGQNFLWPYYGQNIYGPPMVRNTFRSHYSHILEIINIF